MKDKRTNNLHNNKRQDKENSIYKNQVDWLLRVWRRQRGKTFITLNDEQKLKKFIAHFSCDLKPVLERMIRDKLLEKAIHIRTEIKTEVRYYFTVSGMSYKISSMRIF